MHFGVCVCVCVCVLGNIYVHIHICMVCAYMHIQVYMYAHIYSCNICVRIYMCTHMYVHIYVHMHTHMYMASLVAQWWRIVCQWRRCRYDPWIRMISCWRKWQPKSSILACKIPCTEELGRLQSMGLQRVKHDLEIEQLYIYIYI